MNPQQELLDLITNLPEHSNTNQALVIENELDSMSDEFSIAMYSVVESLHQENENLREDLESMQPPSGIHIPADDAMTDYFDRLVQKRIDNPEYEETNASEVFFWILNELKNNC